MLETAEENEKHDYLDGKIYYYSTQVWNYNASSAERRASRRTFFLYATSSVSV